MALLCSTRPWRHNVTGIVIGEEVTSEKKLKLLFGYMRGSRLFYIGAIIFVGISQL